VVLIPSYNSASLHDLSIAKPLSASDRTLTADSISRERNKQNGNDGDLDTTAQPPRQLRARRGALEREPTGASRKEDQV